MQYFWVLGCLWDKTTSEGVGLWNKASVAARRLNSLHTSDLFVCRPLKFSTCEDRSRCSNVSLSWFTELNPKTLRVFRVCLTFDGVGLSRLWWEVFTVFWCFTDRNWWQRLKVSAVTSVQMFSAAVWPWDTAGPPLWTKYKLRSESTEPKDDLMETHVQTQQWSEAEPDYKQSVLHQERSAALDGFSLKSECLMIFFCLILYLTEYFALLDLLLDIVWTDYHQTCWNIVLTVCTNSCWPRLSELCEGLYCRCVRMIQFHRCRELRYTHSDNWRACRSRAPSEHSAPVPPDVSRGVWTFSEGVSWSRRDSV